MDLLTLLPLRVHLARLRDDLDEVVGIDLWEYPLCC